MVRAQETSRVLSANADFLFSDGKEHELMSLLEVGATLYRFGSDMNVATVHASLLRAIGSLLTGHNS
jgi:hypothetical protein